jgi:hypothetical protein
VVRAVGPAVAGWRKAGLLSAFLPVAVAAQHNGAVSAQEIDQYLDALEESKRATLALLRQTILDLLPEAEQGISYGVAAFRVRGKTVAGFAAFKGPPELPAAQRFRLPPAQGRAQGLLNLVRGTALRYRPRPARTRGGEADRGTAPAGLPRLRQRHRHCRPEGTASYSSPGISEQSVSEADPRRFRLAGDHVSQEVNAYICADMYSVWMSAWRVLTETREAVA